MLNSLDSVTHAVACLQENNKGFTVKPFPFQTNDLSKLVEKVENKYYFGVLTIGNNDSTNIYTVNFDENVAIKIGTNSQIIALFENLTGTDSVPAVIDMSAEGSFRGFEIWVN